MHFNNWSSHMTWMISNASPFYQMPLVPINPLYVKQTKTISAATTTLLVTTLLLHISRLYSNPFLFQISTVLVFFNFPCYLTYTKYCTLSSFSHIFYYFPSINIHTLISLDIPLPQFFTLQVSSSVFWKLVNPPPKKKHPTTKPQKTPNLIFLTSIFPLCILEVSFKT